MDCVCIKKCYYQKRLYNKGDVVDHSTITGCSHFDIIEPKRRGKSIDEVIPPVAEEPDPDVNLEEEPDVKIIGVYNIKNPSKQILGEYRGEGFATYVPAHKILPEGASEIKYYKCHLWALLEG